MGHSHKTSAEAELHGLYISYLTKCAEAETDLNRKAILTKLLEEELAREAEEK